MSDLLKQAIEIGKQLSYEEVEVLYTVLHSINYTRKEILKQEADALVRA